MTQEQQEEVNYLLSKFSNQLGNLDNKIVVNSVFSNQLGNLDNKIKVNSIEFLKFKEDIQHNM